MCERVGGRVERYGRAVGIVALVLVGLVLGGCGRSAAGPSAAPTEAPPTAIFAPELGAGVSAVDLFVEPDDGLRALSQAIRNASQSIWLTMYLLTDRTLIHDLEYAHANGVDVRVILEPHPYGSNGDQNRGAYNNLMAADIPVQWSSSHFRLTHEKSMLIDGTTLYIMTTNFTRSAFRKNREFDVVDRETGDLAAARALFQADWSGREFTMRDADLPLSPTTARPLLTALVQSARQTLDVYAEELQDVGMENVLAQVARRGVRARLILPAPSGADADAAGVATVTAAGVQVHRLPQSFLYVHAKAIVVDDRRAFVGSENLSTASLDDNRELGVIVSDPGAITRLETVFAGDWSQQAGTTYRRHRSSHGRRRQ